MLFPFQRAVGLVCMALFLFFVLSITILPDRTFGNLPFKADNQHKTNSASAPLTNSAGNTSEWNFQAAQDANNYGLSPEQCDAAFPDLDYSLHRSINHRKKIGNIKIEDLDVSWRFDGVVRAMIYENKVSTQYLYDDTQANVLPQLYVINTKGVHRRDYRERSLAVLQSIWRAVSAFPGPIPNIEFSFVIDDNTYENGVPDKAHPPVAWSLTRKPDALFDNLWLMADFGFYVWGATGEYSALRKAITAAEVPMDKKDPRVVWRGGTLPGHMDIRENLLNVTSGHSWANVELFDWSQGKDSGPSNWIGVPELAKYLFPLHTEGRTYSGRLKYILNTHSVPVVHKLLWEENFHHLLVPDGPRQNHIQVERDFSDLPQKIEHYLSHPEEAQRIADNSVKLFRDRYLTPAAQACYWRALFRAWRSVSFEPEFYTTMGEMQRTELERAGDNEERRKKVGQKYEGKSELEAVPRGMPFEEYQLVEGYEDSPWAST
jgi:hypothetical protein